MCASFSVGSGDNGAAVASLSTPTDAGIDASRSQASRACRAGEADAREMPPPAEPLSSLTGGSKARASYSFLRRFACLEARLTHDGLAYTWLLVYLLANVVLWFWGFNCEIGVARYADDLRRVMKPYFSRSFGRTLNLNSAVVYVVASKASMSYLRTTWLAVILPFDSLMPTFHTLCALLIGVGTLFHVVGNAATIAALEMMEERKARAMGASLYGERGLLQLTVTGLLLLCVLVAMSSLAFMRGRRVSYETFYYSHTLFAAAYAAALLIHGAYNGEPIFYKFGAVPLAWYYGDLMWRTRMLGLLPRLRRSWCWRAVCCRWRAPRGAPASRYALHRRNVLLLPGKTIRIELPVRGNDDGDDGDEERADGRQPRTCGWWRAGQYAELRVPALSFWQWHPFTIASAPDDRKLVFMIKAYGNWTARLYSMLADRGCRSGDDDAEAGDHERAASADWPREPSPLYVELRGPFGAPSQDYHQFEHIVLVSGGIGCTPFCSIVRQICHDVRRRRERDERAQLRGGDAGARQQAQEEAVAEAEAEEHGAGGELRESGAPHTDGARDDEERGACSDGAPIHDDDDESVVERSPLPPARRRSDAIVLRAWMYLKTVTAHVAALWLAALRITVVFVALTFGQVYMTGDARDAIAAAPAPPLSASGTAQCHHNLLDSLGFVIADLAVDIVLCAIVSAWFVLDLHLDGARRFFSHWPNWVDLSLLLPSVWYSVANSIAALQSRPVYGFSGAAAAALAMTLVSFFAVLFRAYRIIASRLLLRGRFGGALGARCRADRAIKRVDFIWVSPHVNDDEWLLRDLEELMLNSEYGGLDGADGGVHCRLSRYVTRDDLSVRGRGRTIIAQHITNGCRPTWERVFADLSRGSSERKNDVGVFFCGPRAMARHVEAVMRRTMERDIFDAMRKYNDGAAAAAASCRHGSGMDRGPGNAEGDEAERRDRATAAVAAAARGATTDGTRNRKTMSASLSAHASGRLVFRKEKF